MTTQPHECGPDGNMKSAPQYICELAVWGQRLEARVAELEANLESWENGCVCTDKSRAKAEAAERERIFGLLNNPSFVLTAAIHHDAEGKAWLGENFLACYLNPTIGASDRSMIDAQRDIILGLEARVAELEAEVAELQASIDEDHRGFN